MNGDELSDNRVVSDNGQRVLALELEVLGNIADNSIGVNVAVLADACATAHDCATVYDGAVTNLYVGINGHKRTYFYVFPDFCVRVNYGILMNVHYCVLIIVLFGILYDLCHELGLGDNLLAHKGVALHDGGTAADGRHQ